MDIKAYQYILFIETVCWGVSMLVKVFQLIVSVVKMDRRYFDYMSLIPDVFYILVCYYVFYHIMLDHEKRHIDDVHKLFSKELSYNLNTDEKRFNLELSYFIDEGRKNLNTLRHALCLINFMVFVEGMRYLR